MHVPVLGAIVPGRITGEMTQEEFKAKCLRLLHVTEEMFDDHYTIRPGDTPESWVAKSHFTEMLERLLNV